MSDNEEKFSRRDLEGSPTKTSLEILIKKILNGAGVSTGIGMKKFGRILR